MMPKLYSLTKRKDFDRIFKEGRAFKEDFLILKTIANNLSRSRFGIVVSQKISNKAVTRNKIKRRIKAIIMLLLSKMKKRNDNVLIALPGLAAKDYWEISEVINKLFKKAKII